MTLNDSDRHTINLIEISGVLFIDQTNDSRLLEVYAAFVRRSNRPYIVVAPTEDNTTYLVAVNTFQTFPAITVAQATGLEVCLRGYGATIEDHTQELAGERGDGISLTATLPASVDIGTVALEVLAVLGFMPTPTNS